MFMKIKEKLLKIKDRIKEFCNFLKRKFCDIKNMIKAFLKKMFCYMRNRMKKIWKFLKTNISNVILFIIIVSCFVFGCYHGKFTLEELNKEYVSYFEIVIEAIFLFFVLKEFKMTRKSFEWTEKDRQEKEIHKKISFILYKIVDNFIEHFLVYGFRFHIDDIQDNKTTINIPMKLKVYIYNELLQIIINNETDMENDLNKKQQNIKQKIINQYTKLALKELECIKTNYQMGVIPDEIYDKARSFLYNNEYINKIYKKLTK